MPGMSGAEAQLLKANFEEVKELAASLGARLEESKGKLVELQEAFAHKEVKENHMGT